MRSIGVLLGILFLATSCSSSRAADTSPESIGLPVSLYVLTDADDPESPLSSQRTTTDLKAIAEKMQTIWQSAGLEFGPVVVESIAVPAEVLEAIARSGDSRLFFEQVGQRFDVPNLGIVNGFYVAEAAGVNGFTPSGSTVFFVVDEPTVHDERVTSHEIGHILGLAHTADDAGRLMFSGTNGMTLTDQEIDVARRSAEALTDQASKSASAATLPLQITNQGGSMEGHTPRGFAGSGIGLFSGDNLNSQFPDGEGVQIWLTFDVPAGTPTPTSAVLRSEFLTVRGDPFADLGTLQAEPVVYDSFGPALFNLPSAGPSVACDRVGGGSALECDVSVAVASALDAGDARVQFRLRFDRPADNDGEADLAMFFATDSNTNEPGIFTLDLS